MTKILIIAGQIDVCILTATGIVIRASKSARAVIAELKRWKRSSPDTGSSKAS